MMTRQPTMVATSAFEVDRDGLARKIAHRPKAFILFELIQNAWDESDVNKVTVTTAFKRGVCTITVEDDGSGFADLRSVFTLFRDSKKAPDPEKRGRFELGEKLVIALAQRALLTTTTGTILFENGERRHFLAKRARGTVFEGQFKMTRAEYDDLRARARTLIPPPAVNTRIDGELLPWREPLSAFEAQLSTIMTTEDGALVTRRRNTEVNVYAAADGERAMVYEMGIPIVAVGGDDRFHYDVQQRVPVNWERNALSAGYIRSLRVAALNALHDLMTPEDAGARWVTEAIDDERCSAAATQTVVTHRFGERAVIADPSDPEGTKIAVTKGYTVVPGGALPKQAWANVKQHNIIKPAGQVTPSPKVYDPEGRPEMVIDPNEWTEAMQKRARFAHALYKRLTGARYMTVVIVNEPHAAWAANFGMRQTWAPSDTIKGTNWEECARLCLNLGRLGKGWFEKPNRDEAVLDLLLHEYCHLTCHDHLSHEMHEAATRLGAKLAQVCLDEPELFA